MKKKILVIGHSDIRNTYGASTSIRTHLNLLLSSNFEFYHICQKTLVTKYSKEIENSIQFRFKSMWVPFSQNIIKDRNKGFIANMIGIWIPTFMYYLTRHKIKTEVKAYDPEILHLNSIVLIRLIPFIMRPQLKIIVHVREIVKPKNPDMYFKHIGMIYLFICIDKSVHESLMRSFPDIEPSRTIVIKNPFIIGFNPNADLKKIFSVDKIKLAIVGGIYPDKGIEFVCRNFLIASKTDAELYVIGKINRLAEKLKIKYKSDKIIWLNEIYDFSARSGFMNVDVLIRGESEFCTGRSTYEALESGCYVLQPGVINDLKNDPELFVYSNQIIMYEPGSDHSFQLAIKNVLELMKNAHNRKNANNISLIRYKELLTNIYMDN
jgi:hypothetical protein